MGNEPEELKIVTRGPSKHSKYHILYDISIALITGIVSGLIVWYFTFTPEIFSSVYTDRQYDTTLNITNISVSVFAENLGAKTENNLTVTMNFTNLNFTNILFEPNNPNCFLRKGNLVTFICPIATGQEITIKLNLWRYPKNVTAICGLGPTCTISGDFYVIIGIFGSPQLFKIPLSNTQVISA